MSTTIEMEYDNCCNVSKVPPGCYPNKLSDKCQCNVRFATEKKLCKSKLVYSMKLRLLTSDDISTLKELCMEWFPIKYPDSWYQHVAVDKRFYSLVATFEDKIIAKNAYFSLNYFEDGTSYYVTTKKNNRDDKVIRFKYE